MKTLRLILGFILAPAFITAAYTQDAGKDTKTLISDKDYVFEAQSVSPASGRFRQLTPGYTLVVSGDKVSADLPYFGRAYAAPVDPAKGGIELNSKDFNYTVKDAKKGWDITIKPNDAGESMQLYLTAFDNGSATLQVSSATRQTISFNGFIRPKNTKDK